MIEISIMEMQRCNFLDIHKMLIRFGSYCLSYLIIVFTLLILCPFE